MKRCSLIKVQSIVLTSRGDFWNVTVNDNNYMIGVQLNSPKPRKAVDIKTSYQKT